MTLRLPADAEQELRSIQEQFRFKTKSKAIAMVLRRFLMLDRGCDELACRVRDLEKRNRQLEAIISDVADRLNDQYVEPPYEIPDLGD